MAIVKETLREQKEDVPSVSIKNITSKKIEAKTATKERPNKSKGSKNKDLGRRGELAAARFLYRRGYDIVAQNWMSPVGEADIIARDGDTLVFVEVKTRSDCEKGFPAEAVTKTKREKYERIALAFLADYNEVDITVRFDVVSIVVMSPDRAVIRHHINAFSVD